MRQIILSTAYFPPISYFAEIANADIVLLEAHENYQKQSYRNRCYIAGPNNKQMLNIPVIRPKGNHTPITEILLSEKENWRNQHWNSIVTAYNSSPFFMYYEDELKDVYFGNQKNLWDFNKDLLEVILSLIQINTPLNPTQGYVSNYKDVLDYRNEIHPKIESKKANQEHYIQVFEERHGFLPELSILDLLFNLGPETKSYISRLYT